MALNLLHICRQSCRPLRPILHRGLWGDL